MVFHSPGPCIHCHGRPLEVAIAVATLVGDAHSGEHYSILIEKLKVSAASGSSHFFITFKTVVACSFQTQNPI